MKIKKPAKKDSGKHRAIRHKMGYIRLVLMREGLPIIYQKSEYNTKELRHMTKKEIKNAQTGDIVYDLVKTYSFLIYNYNKGGPIKAYDKHCRDLSEELVKRNVFTEKHVKSLLDA